MSQCAVYWITIESLKIETDGEIDLRGFLGIDPAVAAGYQNLRYTVRVMRQFLRPHPDSRCIAVASVEVSVTRPRTDSMVLSYVVAGNISDIRVPPRAVANRSDGLWQYTCFEAFIRASPGAGYYEFNFSPSTHWAAYTFTGYRSGMGVAAGINAPAIEWRANSDSYTLQTTLELDRLSALSCKLPWRLGLAVVIEDMGGRKSYWALAHPRGKPDFHHEDCFAYEFARTMQA